MKNILKCVSTHFPDVRCDLFPPKITAARDPIVFTDFVWCHLVLSGGMPDACARMHHNDIWRGDVYVVFCAASAWPPLPAFHSKGCGSVH